MGRDRRIADSADREALVTATGNRLQVQSTFASTADLDTIETTLDAIQTLLGGTAKVKMWDGTETLLVNVDGSLNAAIVAGSDLETTLTNLEKATATIHTDQLRVDVISELPAGTKNIGDVDVASSALPTGAATSTLQSTQETTLDAIETLLGGTAKVKLWDGTDTLLVGTDGTIQARAMGLYNSSQVQVKVDSTGALAVYFP